MNPSSMSIFFTDLLINFNTKGFQSLITFNKILLSNQIKSYES
jgi:hypothetical protein